jgi:hypothetical protein
MTASLIELEAAFTPLARAINEMDAQIKTLRRMWKETTDG